MERLTEKKKFNHGEERMVACIDGHIHTIECEDLEPVRAHAYLSGKVIDKLAEYEEAEEQGLLLKLPCKVGDKVFVVVDRFEVHPFVIHSIDITKYGNILLLLYKGEDRTLKYWRIRTPMKHIQEFIFMTQEEAEAKLEEMRKAEE